MKQSDIEELAQRLQDHMEQSHGVCLKASEWNASIAALGIDRLVSEAREEGVKAGAALMSGRD